MTNAEIARVFARIATGLEIDGANPFRVRAYQEAARVIESHPEPIARLAKSEGGLERIRGIGKDLAQKIRDVATTGTTALYDEVTQKYPAEVLELTEIPGLGPKRVKVMFDTLGVRTRADVEQAARAGKIRDLPKFGETVEQKILAALAVAASSTATGRTGLLAAWTAAEALADVVRRVPGVTQVEIAGSVRRRRDTVGDLDLLAAGGDAEAVATAFATHPYVVDVIGRGATKTSVKLASGLQADLRHVPEKSLGAALLYFTGSKAHNIELRRIAIDKGWSLNEYGLTEDGRVVASRTEEEIYRALGLAWIPPEMREALGEIALAARGALPRLIDVPDLRADLHTHTDRSDGAGTLEQMVHAARALGYTYYAVTDHSKYFTADGVPDADGIRRSAADIARIQREVPGIRLLHGMELDVRPDGTLDLDDDAIALLDWVIVSVHSRFDQDADTMTERVLRAISHPKVQVLGHPTGRKIGSREPVRMHLDRVFERAAELGVLMEINAQPDRTDLCDTDARRAREAGVRFVIDTDAHGVRELEFLQFGVFAARRAWLEPAHVMNTLPFEEFERWRKQPVRTLPKLAPSAPATPEEPPAPARARARTGVAGKTTARTTAAPKTPAKGDPRAPVGPAPRKPTAKTAPKRPAPRPAAAPARAGRPRRPS